MNNEYEEAVVLDNDMYPTESIDNDGINIPNLPTTPIDVAKTLAENPEAIRATGELVEKVGDAAPKIIGAMGELVEKVGDATPKIIGATGELVEKAGDAVPNIIGATGNVVEKVGEVGVNVVRETGNVVEKVGEAGVNVIRETGNVVEKVGEAGVNVVRETGNAGAKIIDSTGCLVEKARNARAKIIDSKGDARAKIIDSAGNNLNPLKIVSDTIIKGMELEKEHQKTRQIEAMTNPEFVKAVGKYKNIDHALQKSYRERSESLDQLYESLKSNDKEERIIAMNAISKIVSSSALSELDKIENKHHDPTQPLLDF